MFYFILGLIVGFLPYANSKGWLVTPAIFIVKAVKGFFAKNDPLPLLDMANAAPEASPADKQKFWMTGIYLGAGLFGLLAVFLASIVWYKSFSKEAPITQTEPTMTIEPIPQVTAKAPAQKRAKVATEKIATQAINTPAMPSFEAEKQPFKKPRIDDGFTTEFDKQVLNLESKL